MVFHMVEKFSLILSVPAQNALDTKTIVMHYCVNIHLHLNITIKQVISCQQRHDLA